jgi:hypothetical protein
MTERTGDDHWRNNDLITRQIIRRVTYAPVGHSALGAAFF